MQHLDTLLISKTQSEFSICYMGVYCDARDLTIESFL